MSLEGGKYYCFNKVFPYIKIKAKKIKSHEYSKVRILTWKKGSNKHIYTIVCPKKGGHYKCFNNIFADLYKPTKTFTKKSMVQHHI